MDVTSRDETHRDMCHDCDDHSCWCLLRSKSFCIIIVIIVALYNIVISLAYCIRSNYYMSHLFNTNPSAANSLICQRAIFWRDATHLCEFAHV